jgi:Family of unknown function (DUF6441)
MKLAATLGRSLRADMQAELRDIEVAVASGTREAGRGLKTELRRQVASVGLGQRLANSWRDKHYPNRKLDAASLVYSKAPQIIRAFDEGALIRSKRGRFLAIPTLRFPIARAIAVTEAEPLAYWLMLPVCTQSPVSCGADRPMILTVRALRHRRMTSSELASRIGCIVLAIPAFLGLIAFVIIETLAGRDRSLSRRSARASSRQPVRGERARGKPLPFKAIDRDDAPEPPHINAVLDAGAGIGIGMHQGEGVAPVAHDRQVLRVTGEAHQQDIAGRGISNRLGR